MPISGIDGCNEEHWADVLNILNDAINSSGLEPNLVSSGDDSGIIQKRIIQNLYDNPIVVCDVSGKNPNVMFELGMRLAFDKPTIIIKDDQTSYSFDTSSIEHISYPRDLRYNLIEKFKTDLKLKLMGTLEKAATDPNYTTFLKHFGAFTVPVIETKELSKDEYILDELSDMRTLLLKIHRESVPFSRFMNFKQKSFSEAKNTYVMPGHDYSFHMCKAHMKQSLRDVLGGERPNTDELENIDKMLPILFDQQAFPKCFDKNNTECMEMYSKAIKSLTSG